MKFKIKLEGLHCTGCTNLIKMALEDENLTKVVVYINPSFAEFESDEKIEHVESKLTKAFAPFKQYKYLNLEAII